MRKILILVLILGFAAVSAAQEKALETYVSEAQALQKEGKSQEAVDLMKEAVKVFSKVSDAYLQLGLAWGQVGQESGQSGDFQLAMTAINEGFGAFEKAIELDPKNFDAYFYYGVYGVNVPIFFGKLESGVKHLEMGLALLKGDKGEGDKDQLTSVYRFLGQGYQMQERFADSKAAWEKVLELSPEGEAAVAAKGALKSMAEAKKEVQASKAEPKKESKKFTTIKDELKKSPDDIDTWIRLGQAYDQDQQFVEAREAFKKALELDPKHARAQFLLAMTVVKDAQLEYDERVYKDTSTRTNLVFEFVQELENTLKLDPDNTEAKMMYASGCVFMPFFANRIDEGLAMLKEMSEDVTLSESDRAQALYMLGFGYRKKGNALWMKLLKNYPKSGSVQGIYDEFGLRETVTDKTDKTQKGEKVMVSFHLGFMDELAPQTGVWVEDSNGKFVKTLYVSGFSAHAREKQINLPDWSKISEFETDGTTGASIDWGKHAYTWDLTDQKGKRVKDGVYKVHVEVSWWPSMQYGRASTEIIIGKKSVKKIVREEPFVPLMEVEYIR